MVYVYLKLCVYKIVNFSYQQYVRFLIILTSSIIFCEILLCSVIPDYLKPVRCSSNKYALLLMNIVLNYFS